MSRAFGYVAAAILIIAAGALLIVRAQSWQRPAGAHVAQVTTATVQDETPVYKIDARYPEFGIAAIDTQIKSDIDGAISEIRSYPANPADMASPQNELTIRYDRPYIGPDVVSAKLYLSQYTGGAHPNTLVSGLNFDRASGTRLLQDDAFKMIGLTVDQVSTKATAELKAKLGGDMFEDGANSNPENFSSFLISADKVTFIFQPYQVAAYAAGAQEVSFPRIK